MPRQKKALGKGIAIIKKANQLIEARYKFDIWESRFFLSILSQIRRDDDELDVYRIWYKDVAQAFGLKSHQSYDLLRAAAKSLMAKSFFINYEKDGVEREVQYHILRKIDYIRDGDESPSAASMAQEYIDVTIEAEMKPLLLQLQRNFTAYDLRNVVKLGAYPMRFYELLKQYEAIGERTLYVDELKRQLELTNEYPRFPNFYQKVVQPAVREINAHTDLAVRETDRVKQGKKVAALVFSIRKKSETPAVAAAKTTRLVLPAAPSEPLPQVEKDRLFLKFQPKVVGEMGVSPSIFLQELDRVGEGQIEQAVRVTERAKAEGRVKNLPGFFVEALRKGFTDSKEEGRKKQETDANARAERARKAEKLEQLRDEMAMKMNDAIRNLTVAEPDIAEQAVEALRLNPIAAEHIAKQEDEQQKRLEMQDFRADRTLREWVKTQIRLLRPTAFEPFFPELERQILEIAQEMDARQ